MKLSCSTGSFELLIKGYGRKGSSWRERNSLLCQVSTEWETESHSQSTPLQTWEVSRMIDGLKMLWNRAVGHLTMSFAEPGLSVDATALPNEKYKIQIQLDQAMTPAWHPYPDFPLLMDVTLTRQQLRDAIQNLTRQLATYPER